MVEHDADRELEETEKSEKRKAKRDSSTAPANFFVGTKKEEKIGRLRSE